MYIYFIILYISVHNFYILITIIIGLITDIKILDEICPS